MFFLIFIAYFFNSSYPFIIYPRVAYTEQLRGYFVMDLSSRYVEFAGATGVRPLPGEEKAFIIVIDEPANERSTGR